MTSGQRVLSSGLAAALLLSPVLARGEVPVQRTFFGLPSSNGHGAVLLDLQKGYLTHFREHLFATEEAQVDAAGNDVWDATIGQFGSVSTRDLLYDAYFGLRFSGDQTWLKNVPVDLDASGYAPWKAGATGGTGVAMMVQTIGSSLRATQYVFAPRGLPHAGFVMAMRLENIGAATMSGVQAFSLHNFHLGTGRPGVTKDTGEENETIVYDGADGKADFLERAFAGVVVARALGPLAHHGASSSASAANANVYAIVDNGGSTDLPDLNGAAPTANGSISAYQWNLGSIPAGESRWVGVVFAHQGDPFGGSAVQGWLGDYIAGRGAEALVTDELADWAAFQESRVKAPPGLEAGEESLLRQSAVTLKAAQNLEDTTYLREFLTKDGETRYTRFGTSAGGPPATLPDTVVHRGKGAVIASLPPGQWTYAWIRDGAYATAAMAELGMAGEAKDALLYYLGADAGRFQSWDELSSYGMPPYKISLVRYHGFGVEETDFNDFGPNLEFDGFGLFLWALGRYEQATGDTSVADDNWQAVSTGVADVLVALIDPATGLLRPDSSIWETHWNGRQRAWAYSNITAVRGLCDAADIAARRGESGLADKYRQAGISIRAAIAGKLTDSDGAIASNMEELAAGEGYWDAAVIDAVAMGLFDPQGTIAKATLAGIDAHLATPAGAGWSRDDDDHDHAGATDVSPWGSGYDSPEWVVTDMRGAVAARMAGDSVRSDRLIKWVRDQSVANYLAVSETYDPDTGTYTNNAPMVGFGAGVYALALLHREGASLVSPACGAYYEGGSTTGAGGAGGGAATTGTGGSGGAAATSTSSSASTTGAGGSSADADGLDDSSGCGCKAAGSGSGDHGAWVAALAAAAGWIARRKRARA